MKITPTAIEGVLILEPKVFGDERGFFLESFNLDSFTQAVGQEISFVQDNHSRSAQGVLRGLHFQVGEHAQGKLVRVSQGSVFDVAVDIRPDSETFGRWIGVELSGSNHKQLWIPPGLAHGFLVLSEFADFLYKATAYYTPAAERSMSWNDDDLKIAWPLTAGEPVLSSKDAGAPGLQALFGRPAR